MENKKEELTQMENKKEELTQMENNHENHRIFNNVLIEKENNYNFSLLCSTPPDFSPVRLPGYRFIYESEKIEKPTTTREIWKASESFLKECIEKYNDSDLIEKYTNHRIKGYKTILATYQLAISREEKDEDKPPKEKVLYSSIYKIEGEEKTKIEEKKYIKSIETIEPNFRLFLVPTVYAFRERAHNPRESIDEEKKNIFRLSKCCICKKKPPNVLFLRCFHRVVCSDCDESEKFKNCPICKNNLHGTRNEIFFKGTKKLYYTTSVIY